MKTVLFPKLSWNKQSFNQKIKRNTAERNSIFNNFHKFSILVPFLTEVNFKSKDFAIFILSSNEPRRRLSSDFYVLVSLLCNQRKMRLNYASLFFPASTENSFCDNINI